MKTSQLKIFIFIFSLMLFAYGCEGGVTINSDSMDESEDSETEAGKDDSATAYTLHFYPKLTKWSNRYEKTGVMIVMKGTAKIAALYTRGGPKDPVGTASKTPAGTKSVLYIGPKQGSGRWPMSIVRWGAKLEVDEDSDGQVTAVYESYINETGNPKRSKIEDWKLHYVNSLDFGTRKVGLIFGDDNQDGKITTDEMTVENMNFGSQVRDKESIYTNDFGHKCADLGNGVFLHPTAGMYNSDGRPSLPCSELDGDCNLGDSHGCIHISPIGFDYLIENQFLTRNAKVVVHTYDESAPADTQTLLNKLASTKMNPWVGDECADNTQCSFANGKCLNGANYENGFCSVSCTRSCSDRAGELMTLCVDMGDGAGQCTHVCTSSADCREGYKCDMKQRFNDPSKKRYVCIPE